MSTIFDNFNGTVDLSVFSKKNPDPKTSLRRHYLSLVGLLQYVDIMNGDAEGSLPAGWNENTIAGMLNHCIGDLDTRMAAISPSPAPVKTPDWFWCESVDGKSNVFYMKGHETAQYEYSFDGIEWSEYDGVNDPEFTDKIYVRALPQEVKVYIDCDKPFNIGGNILSLLYGSEFTGEETEFPAGSSFADYFTESLVYNASQLILPIYLVESCFSGMFYNCSDLVVAPEIFATTMADGCFINMFTGCGSLTEVKIHIEGEWDRVNTTNWLDGVAETGVLYNFGGATGIPTNDADGCPEGWTIYPNPNTVPGEEPSNPIDVTGTELEQLLEQDPVQGVQDMVQDGGMQGVQGLYYNGTPNGTQGTQGTPEEEEEEEELNSIRNSKSSTPQTVQIGYFYNVTEPSTRFAKGVYTIIDEKNAVPFTAVVTDQELKNLQNEDALKPGTTYFVLSSKGNTVCYAYSTNDADKIYQQPTGWTPKNPIMVTGQELDDLIDRDLLNDGYFYNVADTTEEYDAGLYVAVKGDVKLFDWNNMVTSGQLSQMAADEELTPNAIYYISDYYGDEETNAVVYADNSSKVVPIERSRTPKPIPEPGPEPEPKGWTFNDPIECTGKELTGYIASSKLYQYYFYYADSYFEQIKAETTYLATEVGVVVEFDKNNAQLDENIQKMAQLETLNPDAYYFATDTEVLYHATSKRVLKPIKRTLISDK